MKQIINPYDTSSEDSIDLLLYEKKIIKKDNNNFYWYASIFPKSTINNDSEHYYSRNRIVTKIDDSIFTDMGFIILSKQEQVIVNNNKRSFIKCKTYGDYIDSVKRYTNINKPVNIVENAADFLNLPKLSNDIKFKSVIEENLNFKMEDDMSDILPKKKPDLFEDHINHPHINKVKLQKKSFKFNSKDYIIEVLKWAKDKGVKYIYCINEHRPYIQNKNYVTPYVYYTIKGY